MKDMEFKGTKNEWYIGEHRQNGIQIGCNQSHYVACAYRGGSDRTDDETIANAQLIACAPELLKSLQLAIQSLTHFVANSKLYPRENYTHEMWKEDKEILNEARNVINKALGKEDGHE